MHMTLIREPFHSAWTESKDLSLVWLAKSCQVRKWCGRMCIYLVPIGPMLILFQSVSSQSMKVWKCNGHSIPMHASISTASLKAKIFTLGEWYSCRGLAVVADSRVWTLRFKTHSLISLPKQKTALPHSKQHSLKSVNQISSTAW